MASSLLNEPHPNIIVHGYQHARDPLHSNRDEAELKARAYYLERAAKGDPEAKLMLKSHPRWKVLGWWNREHGDVMGELSKVVKEMEGR